MIALTQTGIRREVGAVLRPIRDALHAPTERPATPTVELRGYTFTGSRRYKAPGQIGYVWMPSYRGHDQHGRLVFDGTLNQVAGALYWRLKAAENCRAEWDNVNDPPCHPSDMGWNPCGLCAGKPISAEIVTDGGES